MSLLSFLFIRKNSITKSYICKDKKLTKKKGNTAYICAEFSILMLYHKRTLLSYQNRQSVRPYPYV